MTTVEKAIELIQGSKSRDGLALLLELQQHPNPPKDAFLVWAAAVYNTPFKFLSLVAARKEFEIHKSDDAKNLASKLIRESIDKRKAGFGITARICLIGILNSDNKDDWLRTIDSLGFQLYTHVELLLVTSETTHFEFPQIVKIIYAQGSELDLYEVGIRSAEGEVVSLVEFPGTVFADSGLVSVASAFESTPQLACLQTERVFYSPGGFPEAMRFNIPEWSFETLSEERNLIPPTMIFRWHGVFFKCADLREFLPLSREFPSACAHELALRMICKKFCSSGGFSVLLGDCPVRAKGHDLSLREIAEHTLLMQSAKRKFDTIPRTSKQPRNEVRKPSMSLPTILPEILVRGEKSQTKISLVTASYNCKEFIERCVDSIISQNYPYLEFIVLDGGSTDGTREILEKFKRYFSYFRSEKDDGHYSAIQEGMMRATGAILSWLNADDLFCPYTLRLVADIFSSRKDVSWVTGRPALTTENDELDIYAYNEEYDPAHYLNDGFDAPFIQQEGTFWRRDLWDKAGGALDLRLDLAADMELWTRFFQITPVYTTTVPLGIFRQRAGQRSEVFKFDYYREAVMVTEKIKARNSQPALKQKNKSYILEY